MGRAENLSLSLKQEPLWVQVIAPFTPELSGMPGAQKEAAGVGPPAAVNFE